MRINAKGLHWTTVALADGTKKTYWYAWRGGPRLYGEYASPEFIASYNTAVATKVVVPEGRLLFVNTLFGCVATLSETHSLPTEPRLS